MDDIPMSDEVMAAEAAEKAIAAMEAARNEYLDRDWPLGNISGDPERYGHGRGGAEAGFEAGFLAGVKLMAGLKDA